MVVCDPMHRQYLLLPPLPGDLAISIVVGLATEGPCFGESFLAPPGDEEEAAATTEEGTSFRVIWMMLLKTKPMAAVFSSSTGQWRAITCLSHIDSLPGFLLSTWKFWFVSRHYAHGCFYWVSGTSEKLLVLDIRTMEFSMVDHPPCPRFSGDDVAIVEAGQGMTVMFVPKPDTGRRFYTVWRKNGGSSTQWQMENEPFLLDSGSLIKGAVGRHLLLYYVGSSSVKQGCYTRDVDTFQFERVCGSCPDSSEAYCNLPPSLLSSPTVSSASRSGPSPLPGCRWLPVALRSNNRRGFRLPRSCPLLQRPPRRRPVCYQATGALATSVIPQGTRHADAQGMGDDVLVRELREADSGGVQGPVVAADAQALNPLFVVEGSRGDSTTRG
ncbi:uncharacterized protein [Triticum aestivum]|uniref:uncharacterized protein isoform X2 n=1 Tax=Triticum aestivum TaxID=4565 RepID=UPI001D004F0A|nr:uncharacterized protein LOC123191018 isoform X2 [Triticum aestivum]